MAFQVTLPNFANVPTPLEIQGYVENYDPADDEAPDTAEQLLPEEDNMSEAIAWDVKEPVGGLVEAYDPDGDPMIDRQRVLKTMTEETMYWAIRKFLSQKDILRGRKAGTNEVDGEALMMDLTNDGLRMLRQRLRQQRWATLFGQNLIDSNGVIRNIDYSGQLAGTPSAEDPWNVVADADPIWDLQVWSELFDDITDGEIILVVNPRTLKYLSNNAKFRDLVKQSGQVVRLGSGSVSQLLLELAGVRIKEIRVERGKYRTRAGTLHYFVPEGKALLVAAPPKGQSLGAFRTTPSTYKGGFNPQPGRFSVVDDKLLTRGRWSIMIGQHGLPVLYFPKCIAVATLYTPA